MNKYCFYVIDDSFFQRFPDPYLKGNKDENRPHYYCFQDEHTGLYWIIPLSSKVDKFKSVIKSKLSQNKPCDILYVCKLGTDKESAFLIQDMFPITEKYIKRPYTINSKPLILMNEKDRKIIEQKAKRILNLINNGIKFTPFQVDVLKIKASLLKELESEQQSIACYKMPDNKSKV